jgi:hypothetical protein
LVEANCVNGETPVSGVMDGIWARSQGEVLVTFMILALLQFNQFFIG